MQPAPIHKDEQKRLEAVKSLQILDTPPEERFDVITREASERLKVPISTITIVDSDREWFKSYCGLDDRQGGRDVSFCGHAMLADYVFIVADTLQDPRFKDNPYVVGPPHIRFYAGVALHDLKSKLPVGVLCVKDYKPRRFTLSETNTLIELAMRAEQELNKLKV